MRYCGVGGKVPGLGRERGWARQAARCPIMSNRSSRFASSRALASSLTWARISAVLASAAARSSSLLRLHLLDHRVLRLLDVGQLVLRRLLRRHAAAKPSARIVVAHRVGIRDCIAPSIDDVGTSVPKPDYTPSRGPSEVIAATRVATAASQCSGGGAVTARRTCEVPPKSSPGHRPTP